MPRGIYRKPDPGSAYQLRECAICLLKVGLGKKATSRLTGIPKTIIVRMQKLENIPTTTRKTLSLKHILRNQYNNRKRSDKRPSPKPLPLLEFKGQGREWDGFELFPQPKPRHVETEYVRYQDPGIEEWRPIKETWKYKCSSLGRFKNIERGNIVKGKADPHGYIMIGYMVNGRQIKRLAHRIICEAFHGPPPSPGHQVNHKNRIKQDNRASNLEWVTRKENCNHWASVPDPRVGRKLSLIHL